MVALPLPWPHWHDGELSGEGVGIVELVSGGGGSGVVAKVAHQILYHVALSTMVPVAEFMLYTFCSPLVLKRVYVCTTD